MAEPDPQLPALRGAGVLDAPGLGDGPCFCTISVMDAAIPPPVTDVLEDLLALIPELPDIP